MVKYTGHIDKLEDLKTGAPSVFMTREICIGIDRKPPSPICCW